MLSGCLTEAILPKIDQSSTPGKPYTFTCFYSHMILFKGVLVLNEGTVDAYGDQVGTGALKCAQNGFEDFYCVVDEPPDEKEDVVQPDSSGGEL